MSLEAEPNSPRSASEAARTQPPPLPYEHCRDIEWATKVNRWPWTATEGGHVKTDICPRCGHRIRIFHPGGARAGGIAAIRLPDVSPILVHCNCGSEHPGTPADEASQDGCGYHGPISRPPFRL